MRGPRLRRENPLVISNLGRFAKKLLSASGAAREERFLNRRAAMISLALADCRAMTANAGPRYQVGQLPGKSQGRDYPP